MVALAGGCVNGHEPRRAAAVFRIYESHAEFSVSDNACGVSAYLSRFIQPKEFF
jgi:hypothetical protein